jgi:hypothetical protein
LHSSISRSDQRDNTSPTENMVENVLAETKLYFNSLCEITVYHIYCFRTKVALIVKLLQTVMRENDDQNLAGDLLKKCFDEKMLTKESLTKVC